MIQFNDCFIMLPHWRQVLQALHHPVGSLSAHDRDPRRTMTVRHSAWTTSTRSCFTFVAWWASLTATRQRRTAPAVAAGPPRRSARSPLGLAPHSGHSRSRCCSSSISPCTPARLSCRTFRTTRATRWASRTSRWATAIRSLSSHRPINRTYRI